MKSNAARTAAPALVPTPSLTAEDLKILRAPLPKDRLGVKVQSYSKDRTRAMLVLYLQHTDVQERLEEVDPAWSFEVLQEERLGDTTYARARLTLKGVARENVGEGGDPKAAYSDALKRCAMLFGVGRYLYESETVWTEYNEARDRFKAWSVADYERAMGGGRSAPAPAVPEKPAASAQKAPVQPKGAQPGLKTETRNRDFYNRTLMKLYRPYLKRFPDTRFADFLQERYGASETRLMTLEQLKDLVQFMEGQLEAAGEDTQAGESP